MMSYSLMLIWTVVVSGSAISGTQNPVAVSQTSHTVLSSICLKTKELAEKEKIKSPHPVYVTVMCVPNPLF